MKTFTVKQIKKYILSQDSMGDILYNLNEVNIEEAQKEKCHECDIILTEEESDKGDICDICHDFE